jgi:hypothetical protein
LNIIIHAVRQAALTGAFAVVSMCPGIANTIYHVNAGAAAGGNGLTWGTAFQTVQPAINAASATLDAQGNPDEVWIAEGVYVTPNNGGYIINKPLRVYGGFKGTELDHDHRLGTFLKTVLEGDIGLDGNPLNNALHVVSTTGVTGHNAAPGLLIDGLLIQNGYAQGAGVNGAGILSIQTDLDLANCYLRHNYGPAALGGGIFFTSYVAGVAPASGYRLRIKDSELSDNTGVDGGGIYGERVRGEVVNTLLYDNRSFPYGGGAYVTKSGTGDRLDFTNCVFWANSCSVSGLGGGVYVADVGAGTGGNVQIVNCDFSDNSGNSGSDGQAMVISTNSTATIYNSIFYWNGTTGGGSPKPISGAATIDYSDIEGGWSPGTNINQDPMFANHTLGRLTLLLSSSPPSPCLDAADYGRLPQDDMDVDNDGVLNEVIPLDCAGQARWVDQSTINPDGGTGTFSYLDMGAFERP